MRSYLNTPSAHLFVCANRREENHPLGSGCAQAGEDAFGLAKKLSLSSPYAGSVWITKTHCLGLCPKKGCAVSGFTVSLQKHTRTSFYETEVLISDIPDLFQKLCPPF